MLLQPEFSKEKDRAAGLFCCLVALQKTTCNGERLQHCQRITHLRGSCCVCTPNAGNMGQENQEKQGGICTLSTSCSREPCAGTGTLMSLPQLSPTVAVLVCAEHTHCSMKPPCPCGGCCWLPSSPSPACPIPRAACYPAHPLREWQ